MNEKYLEFRCPNASLSGTSIRCSSLCGGVAASTLESYDFSMPYKDIRYCGKCNGFFEVILKSIKSVIKYRILAKGERISFTPATSYLSNLASVAGRRMRNGTNRAS